MYSEECEIGSEESLTTDDFSEVTCHDCLRIILTDMTPSLGIELVDYLEQLGLPVPEYLLDDEDEEEEDDDEEGSTAICTLPPVAVDLIERADLSLIVLTLLVDDDPARLGRYHPAHHALWETVVLPSNDAPELHFVNHYDSLEAAESGHGSMVAGMASDEFPRSPLSWSPPCGTDGVTCFLHKRNVGAHRQE